MDTIKFREGSVPASYLGDGVYAIFDGFGIWLHANDHADPTDKIYLEPPVLENLVEFSRRVREPEVVEHYRGLNNARESRGRD